MQKKYNLHLISIFQQKPINFRKIWLNFDSCNTKECKFGKFYDDKNVCDISVETQWRTENWKNIMKFEKPGISEHQP